MSGKYYVITAGERRGPFLRAELETQGLSRDTLVWRKGLADWLPAGRVAELLDVFDEPPPLPGAAPPLEGSAQFKEPNVTLFRPESAPPAYADESPEFTERDLGLRRVPYDRSGLRRLYFASSYVFVPGLLALLLGGALFAYLVTFGPGGVTPRFDPNTNQVVHDLDNVSRQFRLVLAIATVCAMGLGAIAVIIGIACYCVLLYRAWAVIQDGRTFPSPGRAVGFLFIPFFNPYWCFIAVYGLARKLNRFVERYDLEAPTASQPLGFAVALYLALLYVPIPFAAAFALGLLLIVLPFFMRSIYLTTAAICDEANQERIAQAPRERVLYQPELTRPVSAHVLSIVAMVLAPIGTVVFVIACVVQLHTWQHYDRDAQVLRAIQDGVAHLAKQDLAPAGQNQLLLLQRQARNLEPQTRRWSEELLIGGVVLAVGILLIGLSIGLALAARHCARVGAAVQPQPPPAWPLSHGADLLAKNARSP